MAPSDSGRMPWLDGVVRKLRKLPEARSILLRRRFRAVRYAFYDDLWHKAAANVGAVIEPAGEGQFTLTRKGRSVTIGAKDIRLDREKEAMLADKSRTHKLLTATGLPIPRHHVFTLDQLAEASAFLGAMPGGVVVKPADGTGAGRGVTTGVSTPTQFEVAARYAARYNPLLIAEEQIAGSSHRLLFLGETFIDAVRKDPPTVTGDGRSTVKDLVKQENQRRMAAQPVTALGPLVIDNDALNTLAEQGLTPSSRPEAGTTIMVKRASNENAAAQNHIVCNQVHPQILSQCVDLIRATDVRFGGIDVMTTDISKPLAETGGAFLEINAPPGIHHHYLVSVPSKAVPLADILFDHLLDQPDGHAR